MAENGTPRPLTPKQSTAIGALLTTSSNEQAARKAGVGLRTLNRWLTLPEFRRALRLAQDAALERTFSSLATVGAAAVQVLLEVAGDQNAPAAARVSAARAILENLLRYAELNALAERVAALEEVTYGE